MMASRFGFKGLSWAFVVALLCLAVTPVASAGPFEWCRQAYLKMTGQPPGPPENPLPAEAGKGYPVLELNADVRRGCLTWTPAGGWTYVENPYRRKLESIITGPKDNRVLRMATFDLSAEGTAILNYVIRMDGTIVLGREMGPQIHRDFEGKIGKLPHSSLASDDGSVQRVIGAGQVKIINGKIVAIDIQSGHYKPGRESIPVVEESFRRYSEILSPDFKGVAVSFPIGSF